MPEDTQHKQIEQLDCEGLKEALPTLRPEAALSATRRLVDSAPLFNKDGNSPSNAGIWSDDRALDMKILRDPQVARWVHIIQKAETVPDGWKRRKWIEAVAAEYQVAFQTVYRRIKAFNQQGLAGLCHTKKTRKKPKSWTPAAVDWWVGLCLKREHRKIAKDALYAILVEEAQRRDWRIGSYSSAMWWLKRKVTPQLLALQRGGTRALDNSLPPILRSYADLEPFEILVGDQHQFDFWVVDEETGDIFRPEGYFWQDLRTRCFYGGALDRKYDAHLIGMALRMGLKIFGAFVSIYTDNGKPELSRYIMGVMKDMRNVGLMVEKETDLPFTGDENQEEINPCVLLPGTHRKAIVKNAKAKMIEGTFKVLEGILRDHLRVPGYVKDLGGDPHENDIDEAELKRLALAGKLLGFREFAARVMEAMDYYNKIKPHRGVRKEWTWKPKPKDTTPMDALMSCYKDGWRPGRISDEAVDLIFLPKADRTVDHGRILFDHELYEHDALVSMPKSTRVEVRYDPMDPEWLLVFHQDEFVCRAMTASYSSMKHRTQAQAKIEQKRRLRKGFIQEYRRMTAPVPDIVAYARTPAIERAAVQLKRADRKQKAAQIELERERTPEEMAAEVARLEARTTKPRAQSKKRKIPARPSYFMTPRDRYKWIMQYEIAGGELMETDAKFRVDYEAGMSAGEREYYETVRGIGI